MARARLRDLGITLGRLPTGPLNAITDVAGVEVAHSTLIRDKPAVVRTGVTMIWPHRDIFTDYCFAGFHSFNGNGERTGTICHEFKGGIGTASRIAAEASDRFTVGVLVQANYGARDLLRVDGVPVGREIDHEVVPSHRPPFKADGSIIVILATDAPLLP